MQEKQIASKMFWIHCAEVAHPGSGARGRTASKSSLVVHARTIRVALGAYLLQIELLGETTLRLLVEQGTNNDSKNAKGSSKKKWNLHACYSSPVKKLFDI